MVRANIDRELATELAAVADEAGCELINAEFLGGVLRIIIDRPEGVTLENCSNVSRQISALLDVADFGRGRYTLEVSSPGLDRQLYGPKDYERFCGRLVRVTWRDPETRQKRTVVGRLSEFRAGESTASESPNGEITVVEPATECPHDIALRNVQVARLEIEL